MTSKASQITNGESSNPETQTAPLPAQIVRYEGRTETVRIPVVTERWSATAVPTVPPQQKVIRFVGRFPGFEAAKREANLRARRNARTPAYVQAAGPVSASSPSSQAVVFDGPNESDTPYIPPNPNLAAGPNYIVVLINSLIAIYDKSGNLQGGFNELPTFFSSLGVTGDVYDPRVIYDQNDNRFIMSFTNVDLLNPTFGNVLIAVSETSDPTGNWYKFMLSSKGFNAADNAATFPDFPTLGLSPSAIYISNGQFELNSSCTQNGSCSFSDTWLRVIGLPGLLSGNPNLSITTFTNVRTATRFPAFAIESALTYGASSEEFLVAAEFSANPGFTLNVFAINTAGTPRLSTANLTVPGFGIPAEADQPGGTIETGDFRPLNAVASNGILWCAQNSANDQGVGAVGRWYAISIPSLAGLALSQTGTVVGSGSTYFPAIAAKPNGDVTMSFTTSSFTQFASAAFTGRAASDVPGTMRGYAIYRQGTANYNDFAFRWGDYNGASVDPDGNSVWIIVEYAGSPNPHFGTAITVTSSPPTLTVSPAIVTFSGQNYGTTSAPQTLTVTNTGTGSSIINSVAIVPGQFSYDFPVTNDQCTGSTLTAGGSCTVSVSFNPALTGKISATLEIASSSPGLPALVASVPLSGISISGVATFSPTTLTFPATPIRTISAPLTVTLTNTGNGPMGVGPIYISSGIFAQTNNCPAVLAASANCAIKVTFRPISEGSLQEGTLIVQNAAPGANVFVDLIGSAITAPGITLCPTSLAFGNQAVGTSSSSQTVTISNTGTSNLSLTTITASGDFAQRNTCGLPATLPPGTACNVSVTFTPTTTGTRTGTLRITDNAAGSPQTVALNGNGSSASASLAPVGSGSNPHVDGNSLASLGIADYPINRPLMPRVKEAFANSPLAFEAGEVSSAGQVKFLARGSGYTVQLTADEALVAVRSRNSGVRSQVLIKAHPASAVSPQLPPVRGQESQATDSVLRMQLVGANLNSSGRGLDELPGKSNYFLGNDPAKWRVRVPNFAKVKYEGIYPGTDLIFHGNQKQLEFDFVVAPRSDPRKIRLAFPGADKLSVRSDGDLVISADGEEFRIHEPTVYQPVMDNLGRSTRSLRGRYVLHNRHEVSFEVAAYDHHQPLVIDPVLVYSTFLGGTGLDEAYGIAVDNAGNAYIAGVTSSTDFPVVNAFQSAVSPAITYSTHAFVTKMSSTGTVFYSTYLGGNEWDQAQAIAVDRAGNAYITGYTESKNFPLQNPIQPGLIFGYDAFVTELNATGSALVFSTFLGGNGEDAGFGIAVDSSGNTYVAGVTGSTDFPTTTGAFQTLMTDANYSSNTVFCGDAFVTKINPGGTSLVYSTRLGGSLTDQAQAIAIDAQGNAYVTGTTQSPDFPTTAGAYQTGLGDTNDVFVTKLNPAGTALVYSTHLLGWTAGGIAVNPSGNAYVTGGVSSPFFPTTANAFQPHLGGTQANGDAFVTMLHPAGCALTYSTYLGGSYNDWGNAIALDSAGNAYVTGLTSSSDFPTASAIQASFHGYSNAFVSEISPDGSALPFSTFLGGSGGFYPVALEQGTSIAVDTSGYMYVAGVTISTDFPTLNPIQNTLGGNSDAFVARISPTNVPVAGLSSTTLTFPNQPVNSTSPAALVTLSNLSSVLLSITSIVVGGEFAETNNCGTTVAAGATCVINVTYSPQATGSTSGILTITDNAAGSPQTVTLTGTGIDAPYAAFSPLPLAFPNQLVGTTGPAQPLNLTNSGDRTLNITSIMLNNASPSFGTFAETSNTCGTSLVPGAGCSITLTFTAVARGTGSGTLTVTDDAPGSPQTVALSANSIIGPVASLSVSPGETLNFSQENVGSPSPSFGVNMSDAGDLTLSITTIATTGDFQQTNNCGTSLTAHTNQTCTINITFVPTTGGNRTGNLVITDNAADSPQTIHLTGVGDDFALSATATTASVTAGQPGSYSVVLTPEGRFSNSVSLSCAGAPPLSTCSFSAQSVSLASGNPTTISVTVTTTAPSFAFPTQRSPGARWTPLLPLTFLGFLILLALVAISERRRKLLAPLAATLLLVALWASCGGGGGGGGGNPGTPVGTYTLTVTGTSGSLSHTLNLTLKVN